MNKYKCIKCNKEILSLEGDPSRFDEDIPDTDKMWNGGVIFNIVTGYGSLHDGDMFTGALCDNCIDIMTRIDILKYKGDYITGETKYIPLGENK